MSDMIWQGKRVYIRLKDSKRNYSGQVITEDSNSISIIDIKGHLVQISKSNLDLIQQEESWNKK